MFDVIEIVPPHPIRNYVYKCDSHFHVESIEDLFEDSKKKYGIIILHGDLAEFYLYDEFKRGNLVKTVKARIAKSHKRGGQSQRRIARLHDEQVHNYLLFVEEGIREKFTSQGVTNIKQLIISGPGQKKEQLRDNLTFLTCDITLHNFSDIQKIEDNFESIIFEGDRKMEDKEIQEIKEILELNSDKLVFGKEIDDLYSQGKLQKIWCIKDKSPEIINKTKVIVLSSLFLEDYDGKIGLRWY